MNRDIFSELVEGLDALAAERQGNVTLLTYRVKRSKSPPVPLEESRIFTAPPIFWLYLSRIWERYHDRRSVGRSKKQSVQTRR